MWKEFYWQGAKLRNTILKKFREGTKKMEDMKSAPVVALPEGFRFDGEARELNGQLTIGWEVLDDYGNVVQRAGLVDGKDYTDPTLAPISHLPALQDKTRAARAQALKKLARLATADLPAPEADPQDTAEGMVEVGPEVEQAWESLGLVLTEKNQPVTNLDNCVRILEGLPSIDGRIWFDEFANTVNTSFSCEGGGQGMGGQGTGSREWTDHDTAALWLELQRKMGLARIGKETVHEAVMVYAYKHKRHPVKQWLHAQEWDRVPRIDSFLSDYLGAEDSAYTRATSANFFIGMMARIYKPGCKVDNMLVLEGDQGKQKSSALKALCGEWFTECNDPVSGGNNKDFYSVLQGKMLVEIAELDSFNKADIKRIKAIITTGTDRYRPAYGRLAQNFPRTSVFVGTTNEDEYLEDPTGGRRFWPVRVGLVRLDQIAGDRGQLFAEALIRYRGGASWWIVPKEEAAAAQELRRKVDDWEHEIAEWLAQPEIVILGPRSTLEIAKGAIGLDVEKIDRRVSNRVAYCMKSRGYKMKNARMGDSIKKVWERK